MGTRGAEWRHDGQEANVWKEGVILGAWTLSDTVGIQNTFGEGETEAEYVVQAPS